MHTPKKLSRNTNYLSCRQDAPQRGPPSLMARPRPLWCTVPGCVFVTAPECMDMTDVLQLFNLHMQSVHLLPLPLPSPSSAGT